MSKLLLDSLQRRMRAMHSLYEDAVATMDLPHVNHFEREGVLPIAFCLFHYTNMQDVSGAVISGEGSSGTTTGRHGCRWRSTTTARSGRCRT